MKTRKLLSLSSFAITSAAVLFFGLSTPAAHAQVGFGISIGTPAYGYSNAYPYQPGYANPYGDGDDDGDGYAAGAYPPPYAYNPQYAYGAYPQGYGYSYGYPVQNQYWGRGDDDHRWGRREGDDHRNFGYGRREHDDR